MQERIQEKPTWKLNGWFMLLLQLGLLAFIILLFVQSVRKIDMHEAGGVARLVFSIGLFIVWNIFWGGFFTVQPNESRVITFVGRYAGTVRESGYWWTNPLTSKAHVSLRVRNFNSEKLKVNDSLGNPIEIGAVVVWKVVDSAKALLDVDHYEPFVAIQSETAIRVLASSHPYDEHEEGQTSLRGNPAEIAEALKAEMQARLLVVGVEVLEARISHLAYAPEIAHAMLRRQQAHAVIAARQKIVEGAVGMVEMALHLLESHGTVQLDEEKKASMVNNLLVALVSDSEAQPVINTGTLYS